jgi:hypothetical protein
LTFEAKIRQRLVLSVNKVSYESTVLVADWFALLSIIIQAKSYVWIASMVSMKRATHESEGNIQNLQAKTNILRREKVFIELYRTLKTIIFANILFYQIL